MEFKIPEQPGPIYMSTMNMMNCGVGMVLSVNPPIEGEAGSHAVFKQKAITAGNPGLQPAGGLVAQAAVPQVASTVSIQVAGQGTPGAQPQQGTPGTVVQGTGRTGNVQACGCQCLCGGAVAASAEIGSGGFGGVVGELTWRIVVQILGSRANMFCRSNPESGDAGWRDVAFSSTNAETGRTYARKLQAASVLRMRRVEHVVPMFRAVLCFKSCKVGV